MKEVLQDAERSGATVLPLPPPPSSNARFAPLNDSQPALLGRSTSLRTPSSRLAIPEGSTRRLSNPLPPSAAGPFNPWAARTNAELPLRTSSLGVKSTLAPALIPAAISSPRVLHLEHLFGPSSLGHFDTSAPFDPLHSAHAAPFTPPHQNLGSAPSTPLFPDRQSFLPSFYDAGSAEYETGPSPAARGPMSLEYPPTDGSTHRTVYPENGSGVQVTAGAGGRRGRRRSEGAHGMPRFGGHPQQHQYQSAPLSFSASRAHRGQPPSLYQHGQYRPPQTPRQGEVGAPPYTPPATAAAPTFSLTSQASAPQLRSGLIERTSHAMWVGSESSRSLPRQRQPGELTYPSAPNRRCSSRCHRSRTMGLLPLPTTSSQCKWCSRRAERASHCSVRFSLSQRLSRTDSLLIQISVCFCEPFDRSASHAHYRLLPRGAPPPRRSQVQAFGLPSPPSRGRRQVGCGCPTRRWAPQGLGRAEGIARGTGKKEEQHGDRADVGGEQKGSGFCGHVQH